MLDNYPKIDINALFPIWTRWQKHISMTPLMIAACRQCHGELVKLLLRRNACVNIKTPEDNFNVLHIAVRLTPAYPPDFSDTLVTLIEAGADVNGRSKCNQTPLWNLLSSINVSQLQSCFSIYLESVKILLSHGALIYRERPLLYPSFKLDLLNQILNAIMMRCAKYISQTNNPIYIF